MKVFLFNNQGDSTSPVWWNNFIIKSGNSFSTIPELNTALIEYGAEFTASFDKGGNIDERYLNFETEAHYTWFILKWS